MERVPVGNPVGFGGEARVTAPVGRTHDREPRRPLTIFARRDRDIPVACRQDRDRGAVAVRLPLARAGLSGEPGSRQLGDRHSRQRFRDRDIDDGAGRGQCRVHAGAGGGKAADKGGLFADRADRRFREIVDLPGQQPGNAAGEEQRQVGRRVVGFWSGLSEGRDVYQRRGRIEPAKTVGVVLQSAKLLGAALTDDQVGGCDRIASRRSIIGDDGLAMIEIGRERRRHVRVDAADIRTDIGEETSANGGSQALADLYDPETLQQ